MSADVVSAVDAGAGHDLLLPLAAAAKALGIGGAEPTLWLRRRLETYQHETGKTVLIGNGKSGKAARYRVSILEARRCLGPVLPAVSALDREAEQRVERLLAGVRSDMHTHFVDAIENLRVMSRLEDD